MIVIESKRKKLEEIKFFEKMAIFDEKTKTLNLRGVIHCSNAVNLGNLTINGTGVLIARGITISGPIKKANPNSICVLFSRNGNININTNYNFNIFLV